MEDTKYVLTVEEVGRRLGLSRPSAYQAVKRGEIPIIRIGAESWCRLQRWINY